MKKTIKNKLRYWFHCLKLRSDDCFFEYIVNCGSVYNIFKIEEKGNQNKDKIIYNIEIDDCVAGFFALYRYMLMALYVCDRFHFVPFISLINTHFNKVGGASDNMFEYFYEQQSHLKRDLVENSYNVITYNRSHLKWFDELFIEKEKLEDTRVLAAYDTSQEYISALARVRKKHITYNDTMQKRLKTECDFLLKYRKAIAIHFRGNAYNVGFYGHPIALEISDYFYHIDEALGQGFEVIFVASDDALAVQKLEEKYPGRIVYYQDVTRSSDGIDVHDKAENQGPQIGYEVLRDMYTMAACDGMICGNSQVTIAARIEKTCSGQEYAYFKLLSKGFYKKEKKADVRKYKNLIR